MNEPNREIQRFVKHVGGNAKAGEILGVTPDAVRKIKMGLRGFSPEVVRAMYHHRGFRLSFLRLYDLDQPEHREPVEAD